MKRFETPDVAAAFDNYPRGIRAKLLRLRELIFATASATSGVGELEETLKWGEPAYLTPESRSGSTIRLGWRQARPTEYALYFHCQTSLVESFRAMFPDQLRYEGNRAIVFDLSDAVPARELGACISLALTYHASKKPARKAGRSRSRARR